MSLALPYRRNAACICRTTLLVQKHDSPSENFAWRRVRFLDYTIRSERVFCTLVKQGNNRQAQATQVQKPSYSIADKDKK